MYIYGGVDESMNIEYNIHVYECLVIGVGTICKGQGGIGGIALLK